MSRRTRLIARTIRPAKAKVNADTFEARCLRSVVLAEREQHRRQPAGLTIVVVVTAT